MENNDLPLRSLGVRSDCPWLLLDVVFEVFMRRPPAWAKDALSVDLLSVHIPLLLQKGRLQMDDRGRG